MSRSYSGCYHRFGKQKWGREDDPVPVEVPTVLQEPHLGLEEPTVEKVHESRLVSFRVFHLSKGVGTPVKGGWD